MKTIQFNPNDKSQAITKVPRGENIWKFFQELALLNKWLGEHGYRIQVHVDTREVTLQKSCWDDQACCYIWKQIDPLAGWQQIETNVFNIISQEIH